MWWSRLALVVAVLALGPTGCGFRPLYGDAPGSPTAEVASDLAGIHVMPIRDRLGQQVRNALLDRLLSQDEAVYNLQVILSSSVSGLGQRKDAKATLGSLSVSATSRLINPDGALIWTGSSRSIVNFNFLGPRYASVVVERDAEERAALEVAQDIRRQLAVFFASPRGQKYRVKPKPQETNQGAR